MLKIPYRTSLLFCFSFHVAHPQMSAVHNSLATKKHSPDDFDRVMGLKAQNKTIHVQGRGDAFMADPFNEYYNTCDNGDANPLLPLLTFRKGTDAYGNKTMDVGLNWHLFSFPGPDDLMAKVFPRLKSNGFPVTGPYCFNDQVIAWAMDFNFNSTNTDSEYKNAVVNFVAGCLPGIPCEPDFLSKCDNCDLATTASAMSGNNDQLSKIIVLGVSLIGCIIGAICMLLLACCFRARVKSLERQLKEVKGLSMSAMVDEDGKSVGSATERLLQVPPSSI